MTTGPEPQPTAQPSPDEVYAALTRAIGPDRTIDLAAAARDEAALAGLVPVLVSLRIADSYPLAGAEVVRPGEDSVQMSGSGEFALPGAQAANAVAVRARLSFTVVQGAGRFELSLSVTSPGWTFSTTFPVLPECQIAEASAVVRWQPSYLTGLPLDKPVFSASALAGGPARARLSGTLYPAPVLEPYADFFAPWPLLLDGTMTLPEAADQPPELDLTARSTREPIVVGPVSLGDFGLALRAQPISDAEEGERKALSSLDAVAVLQLGSGAVSGNAWTQLLAALGSWRLVVDFDAPSDDLPPGLGPIAALFGVQKDYLSVVPGLQELAGFRVTEMEVGLIPPGAPGGPGLKHVAATLRSSRRWNPPVPYLHFADVGTRWFVGWGDKKVPQFVSGTFFGTVEIGPEQLRGPDRPALPAVPAPMVAAATPLGAEPVFSLAVTAFFPSWGIEGRLVQGEIPLDDALRYFFGTLGPDSKLKITELSFQADPSAQTFTGSAVVTTDFTVPLLGGIELALTEVGLRIDAGRGGVAGGLDGVFEFVGAAAPGLPDPRFTVAAEYTGGEGADGWVFSGGLYPDSLVELVRLVAKFAGTEPPSWAPQLTLEQLALRFATGSRAYSVAGRVVGRWRPTLFGTQVPLSVEAGVEVSRASAQAPVLARIDGLFTVNRLDVSAALNLIGGTPTYEMRVKFGEAWISAVTGWRGQEPNRHQALTFQVGGVTLGAILEYLVGLVAPDLGFRLEPPWDLLGRIDLSRFTVTVDPTEGAIEFVCQAGAGLPGMSVDSVGVRVRRVNGRPTADLILTGDFLDRSYPPDKPLAWDVLTQSGPAVPGRGSSLLALRYLGVGQRVALRGTLPATVREAVDQLSRAMKPADPGTNPLRGPAGAGVRFAADAEWLIGLDASVADVLDLGFVFMDPRLYGVSVGLRGGKAGQLAGLSFEILYKKISDDVGVFRVELRLPDALRRVQIGSVSVTAGIVVVEIYTNGNFLVDLGFPHGGDFSRSFGIEVFPFLGRGGLYFGVLDGTTSTRVPAVSNGTFSPVIVLGVGLAVGVGKEVRCGPLSGGAYVELAATFEGVFGWFNPSSAGAAAAQYYWVQATVALHGKVYGTVDFKVIRVSATIEAWASASVVLEAYRSSLVRLSASVSVRASVKVLFIRVSFKFTARIDLSFTIGSDRPTPWILTGKRPAGSPRALHGTPSYTGLPAGPRRRPDIQARRQYAEHLARLAPDAEPLRWDPRLRVFPDSPRSADLDLLPVFSADDLPVVWNTLAAEPPAAATGAYRVAFCLFAPNGGGPDAADGTPPAPSAGRSARAGQPRQLSSQLLIEALLRWSLAAVTGSPGGEGAVVTAGQLVLLADQLTRPDTADGPFGLADLGEFFTTNLHWEISGDPASAAGGAETAAESFDGTAIPVPPFLNWTSAQIGDRDLAAYNPVGPLYTWGAARYAAQFTPARRPDTPPPPDDPAAYEPFAAYSFRDWALMVARTAVQAAQDALTSWTVTVTDPVSLAGIASRFASAATQYVVRAGDTMDSVAAALGAGRDELAYLNPLLPARLASAEAGAVLTILLGVAPEAVAADNARVPVIAATLPLGTVDYQVSATDTLDGIARRFGLSGPVGLFADPLRALAEDPALLRPHAGFDVPEQIRPWAAGRELAAATYFVHYQVPVAVDYAPWYTQAVFDLNSVLIEGGAAAIIPEGTLLRVPSALYGAGTEAYVSVAGDTVPLIGTILALAQNFGAGQAGPAGWPAFRDAVRSGDGTVTIPAARVDIQPGESVSHLGVRTIVYAHDLPGLLGWIAAVPVLAPLFVVPVPGVRLVCAAGTDLASLATYTGLPLEELARRVADVPLFAGGPAEALELTVTHLPVQGVDELVDAVLDSDAAAQVAGNSGRQLMSGLRLPAPETDSDGHARATGQLRALFTLTGQMVDGPTPDPSQPDQTGLEVKVRVDAAAASWIRLVDSAVVGAGQSAADLAGRLPDLTRLNPALAAEPERLRPGLIVRTAETGELVYTYTNAELANEYPADTLVVEPLEGPEPLPLADVVPAIYGADRRIPLQTPEPLPIPAEGADALTGVSTAWPLPDALLALARTGSQTRYEVLRAAPAGTDAQADLVPGTTFATLLSFGVRRIADRPHVYELLGADTAGRALALGLYRYLTSPDTPGGTAAHLAAAPAPDASDTAGRAVLQADPAATFVIRANQSTQSVPPGAAARLGAPSRPDAGGYADLADLAGFCLLLWQGSIAAGVGYHFGYGAAGGADLPAGIFDETGTAQLSLLVIAGERQAPAPTGRALLPIDTCVLVGPWLDPAVTALFLEAADDSQTTVQPGTAPGVVGYQLTLQDPGDGESPQARLRRLFSLLTYDDRPQDVELGFQLPASGLPAGPQQDDGLHLALWQRERRERRLRAGRVPHEASAQTSPLWKYRQSLPVSRFAVAPEAPDVPGLPRSDGDPYRGIEGTTLPEVVLQLGFSDVLGNLTAPAESGDDGLVRIPVGYADALLSVAGWPAVTLSYGLSPADVAGGPVRLTVTVAPQPAATAPGLEPEPADGVAERQAERYAQIYYQLACDRVEGYLLTTLRQGADGQPEPLPVDTEPLWRYAAAAYVSARAASAVTPVAAGGSLAAIRATYGVGMEEVARANADRPVARLFGPVMPAVPAYVVVAAGDSADAIVAVVRPGWPRPVSGAALLAMEENTTLPLTPGVVLTTPGRDIVVPSGPEPGTLAVLAGHAFTTPGLLAHDNAARIGILTPDFVFELDGQAVSVPSETPFSFDDVRAAFGRLGVVASVATLAQENAERAGMLREGVKLRTAHYVVGEDETLADTRSGFQARELATGNGGTADLFDTGALVLLGMFGPDRPAPTPGEPLESYAARFGCPPALLLAANADTPLAADAVLVPGAVNIPSDEQRPSVPYTIASADTLTSVAALFAATAEEIAQANAALPGTLAPGRPVAVIVDGTVVTTETREGDSFASVHGRLAGQDPRVTFGDLVAAIAAVPGALAAGGLLLCPPAVLPGAAGAVLRPDDMAAAYHLDAVLVAQANLGTVGLIAPSVRLADPLGQIEVVTGPADTFNTLTARFAQAGAAIDAAAIVTANRARPMLSAGAVLLLPPAPVTVSASLGQDVPAFAAPVFPLSVALRLQRPEVLVVPESRTRLTDGPVERGECVVPAPAQSQGRSDAATLTLAAFAAQFHAALPGLRLGTSRAPADAAMNAAAGATGTAKKQSSDMAVGTTRPDLWVVDFRLEGIASVDVAPEVRMPDGSLAPRCFALRPLYNDLVNRLGVGVRALLPDGTLAPDAVPTDFQGVDAEVSARRVLSDVDLFLSAAYAAGVYADPDARAALGKVLAAKEILAPAVAGGLATVLDVNDPSAADGLGAAIEALRQELAISLSRAYDTAAVVQYKAAVDSPWTRGAGLPPARLSGTAQPAGGAVQGLPYTLTAAKTSLDEAASNVTFLMRVPDPAHHGAVPVDLDYGVLDLEFGIRPVAGVTGYEESAWLAFFPPLAGAAKPPALRTGLGQARIPIPLRAYPSTPSLLGQTARPTRPGPPPDLSATRLWTYSLTYAHEHAEQDEVLVTARFNVRPRPQAAAAADDDVVTAMARYGAVADGLWALLAYWATGDAAVPATVAANAAHTFAGFVEDIARLWDEHWRLADAARAVESSEAESGSGQPGPASQSYDFRVRVGYATDPEGVVLLDTVTLSSPASGPVPAATWPSVAVRAPGGGTVWLVPDSPDDSSRVYRVPAADRIPAGDPPTVTLEWPDLPVDRFQNARAELSVGRNQRLLGPDGPTTREAFVYRTPLTQAPAAVAPLLSWTDPIDITPLGATLEAALASAFTFLSPPGTDLPATLSMQYGYPLVPAADPREELTAYVPVALAPALTLDDASAGRIAAQAADWLQRNDPPAGPARSWALSLSVHSQLDPSASRPLLSFSRLVYRIS